MTITQPTRDSRICIDAAGKITILFSGESGETYTASLLRFAPAPGAGIGAVISAGEMTESVATAGQYSVQLVVGAVAANPPVGTNNREVQVEDASSGDIVGHAFAAINCGSMSQVDAAAKKGQKRCGHCSEDHPVPAAMQLTLDSKVVAGTCAKCSRLNEPAVLRHSADAKYCCCWLSGPIAVRAKGEPAHWILEKTNGSTWTLTLRSGESVLVTYTQKTKKKDCTVPIQLTRVGKGGKECKKWPKTVTVEAAP